MDSKRPCLVVVTGYGCGHCKTYRKMIEPLILQFVTARGDLDYQPLNCLKYGIKSVITKFNESDPEDSEVRNMSVELGAPFSIGSYSYPVALIYDQNPALSSNRVSNSYDKFGKNGYVMGSTGDLYKKITALIQSTLGSGIKTDYILDDSPTVQIISTTTTVTKVKSRADGKKIQEVVPENQIYKAPSGQYLPYGYKELDGLSESGNYRVKKVSK